MASNIFDVQPPAWLQRAATPLGTELGDIAGFALGAGINKLTSKVPVTEEKAVTNPVTGQTEVQQVPVTDASGKPEMRAPTWREAIGETRLNEQNPLWRMGLANTKAQWLSHMASANYAHARTTALSNDAAETAKLSPLYAELEAMTPKARADWLASHPAPDFSGSRMLFAKWDSLIKADTAREANQAEAIRAENRKDFFDRVKLLPPGSGRMGILEMTQDGKVTANAYKALELAEEAAAQKAANAKALAEVTMESARQAGSLEKLSWKDESGMTHTISPPASATHEFLPIKESKLSNGQTVIQLGDSKDLRIIKDPQKEAEVYVARKALDAAHRSYNEARSLTDNKEVLLPFQQAIDDAQKTYLNLFTPIAPQELGGGSGAPPPPANGTRTNPAKPKTAVEASQLAPGSYYVNPTDKKIYQIPFQKAPIDPAQREVNKPYMTPSGGVYLWTGKGWLPYAPATSQ